MSDNVRNDEDFIDSVKEVSMNIRNHRSDDEFERMLAELNGKGQYATAERSEDMPKSEPEPKAAAAMSASVAMPIPSPIVKKTAQQLEIERAERQRKKAREERERKRIEHQRLEKERAEREELMRRAEQERLARERADNERAERERQARERAEKIAREEKEREERLIESINNIWDSPSFSDGGRVSMNIKTEQRKEIKITIPPEKLEAQRIEREKERELEAKRLAEIAQQDAKRRERERINRDEQLAAQARAALEAQEREDARIAEERAERAAKERAEREAKEAKRLEAEQIAAREAAEKKSAIVRKQFALVNVIVCFAAFFVVGFYLLACERESGFIESENRNLAEMPTLSVESLLDGSYFEDLGTWYTDTIPNREGFKSFSSSFSKLFGVSLNDVTIKGDVSAAKKETFDESAQTTTAVTLNTNFDEITTTTTKDTNTTTESEELAEVPDELDDGEWMGSVIVTGTGENVRAMSAFYGTFAMGQKYAETINKYREDLGDAINIYTMNMPLSSAYYMPSNLADQFASQHDCIKNIGSNLVGIMNIDVYDALDEHKEEYIYSRTDHHWTPLGAYYAAQVFSEDAQFDFPDLDTYEECQIEDFVGTMYAYSDYDEELNQNPDTFIYYKPDNDYDVTYYDTDFTNPQTGGSLFFDYASGVNCYSAILGTDDIICEIDTDVQNSRVLVVIKDSFGNALIPYFTHGFEKIYVVDFRYFDINAISFCQEVGCTDLLFAVSISAAHTESHINTIGNIRIQAKPTETVSEPEEIIPDETDEEQDDTTE